MSGKPGWTAGRHLSSSGRCQCRMITAASETLEKPLSRKSFKPTHVDMACKDNVHAMLKEKVLQHHRQAERVRHWTTLSGTTQRQNNALCAFHSCPTSCRRTDMCIQQLLGGRFRSQHLSRGGNKRAN